MANLQQLCQTVVQMTLVVIYAVVKTVEAV